MSTLENTSPMKKLRGERESIVEILQSDATCITMYSRTKNSGQSILHNYCVM